MTLVKQLAKHLRDVHFGGNWTTSNLMDNLADVTWKEATMQVYQLNTIATLVYHINYYISAVLKVLQGEPLNASDSLSFSRPPIHSQKEWEDMVAKSRADADTFAALIEQLPESKLWENFTDEKYGTYYRNIQGII